MHPNGQTPANLILASSSQYRLRLLNQIGLNPICIAPEIDETAHPHEHAITIATRLSEEKARAVAVNQSNALIIAGDQVCDVNGVILGKPGNAGRAKQQLEHCSGQEVIFHTGLCVFNTATNTMHRHTEKVLVHFRHLSDREIDSYIKKEPAFDCAGSFKMEGLGISLFSSIRSDDPNSLIGLPLIKLCEFLRLEGLAII
ncbi:Maf family protein [Zhongshania aquimaris]|uniref:7-methyl-GTP pyrophosphatase n=1 Tax=Zhongshania aquimaris TaxID=2857107 RepID=A0ABS6VLM6_9GAMM|nr:Maf family protein [Zhongshania aquimaris]MBW2939212.1 Maf family nucleotide pyrophosphatase [Zhongshania aquimaris]